MFVFRERKCIDKIRGRGVSFISHRTKMGWDSKLSESTLRMQGIVNYIKKINSIVHPVQLSILKATGIN